MPRFFVDPSQVEGDRIIIRGGDVNHIRNVLRMRTADGLSVSDGQGRDYYCHIEQMDPEKICLRIDNSWDSYVELPVRLTLFQGIPKGDKMDAIVQKAVELGAAEIVPVAMRRCVSRPVEKSAAKKAAVATYARARTNRISFLYG